MRPGAAPCYMHRGFPLVPLLAASASEVVPAAARRWVNGCS
jgi:hypothetical protein